MNIRIISGIAILSTALIAACVSASEDAAESSASATTQAQPEIKVAANEAPAEGDDVRKFSNGEVRQLDEDGFPIPVQKKKLGEAPPPPAGAMTPLERVKAAPVGTLKNPYSHELNDMKPWGKQVYMGNSCNGCHGGTGGGGMCPPLSNATWVYGNDDDTLFRLIALGSEEYQKQYGVTRKGHENVVGPMPAFGQIVKTDDEIWRMISFIRTIYNGDPKHDPRNVH